MHEGPPSLPPSLVSRQCIHTVPIWIYPDLLVGTDLAHITRGHRIGTNLICTWTTLWGHRVCTSVTLTAVSGHWVQGHRAGSSGVTGHLEEPRFPGVGAPGRSE